MTELELIEFLRVDGRYEVKSFGGLFFVRPIDSEEIIISLRCHQECKEHFSKTDN